MTTCLSAPVKGLWALQGCLHSITALISLMLWFQKFLEDKMKKCYLFLRSFGTNIWYIRFGNLLASDNGPLSDLNAELRACKSQKGWHISFGLQLVMSLDGKERLWIIQDQLLHEQPDSNQLPFCLPSYNAMRSVLKDLSNYNIQTRGTNIQAPLRSLIEIYSVPWYMQLTQKGVLNSSAQSARNPQVFDTKNLGVCPAPFIDDAGLMLHSRPFIRKN